MSFTKQILTSSVEEIDRRPDKELVVDSGWETESLGSVIWAAIWGGAHIYRESNKELVVNSGWEALLYDHIR